MLILTFLEGALPKSHPNSHPPLVYALFLCLFPSDANVQKNCRMAIDCHSPKRQNEIPGLDITIIVIGMDVNET